MPAELPSFDAFFRAESARLARALCLITGDPMEAEEVMQEAFVKVLERWDSYPPIRDPKAYLYRTAMNGFRRGRRRAAHSSRQDPPLQSPDAFARVDERDAVVRSLRTLSPRQRVALVLTVMLGYSSEEAAAIMRIRPTTVRVHASAALQALRRSAGEER